MSKNIVICCDGTNNEVAGSQTNVLRLFRMLARGDQQHVFYDAGVGTHADPTAQWAWRRRLDKRLDGAVGMTIRGHVLDAYRFLVEHYDDGDDIFLIGFSRGAYTVRALAGMIYRCGLLCRDFVTLSQYAWSVYSDEDQTGNARTMFAGAARIKKVFGREVGVHFVGVWDTVSTFGWIWDLLTVPNTDKNSIINHFRQALAIDETRSAFQPIMAVPVVSQDIKEVWFAGVHSDVGGGYPVNEGGLSRLSLEWMLCEAVPFGLQLDLTQVKAELNKIQSSNGDFAFDQMHDESQRLNWKIQSWFPKRGFYLQDKRYHWSWPNRPTRRQIPASSLIHDSVQRRMNNAALSYTPMLPGSATFCGNVVPSQLVGIL